MDIRQLRYTGKALAALKCNRVDAILKAHDQCEDSASNQHDSGIATNGATVRSTWLKRETANRSPLRPKTRHIGYYAMTTDFAHWVQTALDFYQPPEEVRRFVAPFAADLHRLCEEERTNSSGLHDIDAIEKIYQQSLAIGAAVLLAADGTDQPVSPVARLHASQAGGDDHFVSWGRLLTGLECDPPIIVIFPFYLLMCQSFTLETKPLPEDYVYSALTGVDWARGKNKFNDRLAAFERLARSSIPALDDSKSGVDRCFWRLALGYLRAMNDCENAQTLKAPRKAAISHLLHPDLVILARGIDTIGPAFMSRDGAQWFDNKGIDSAIGSALPNDVMDLHTDIFTGETRNLLRLLFPPYDDITRALKATSTVLATMLCEIFRGHHRARMSDREDGRISSTSPAYSFCRARHRRIFETLELYMERYPQFWEWQVKTWLIYEMAKPQVSEAGLAEPLICGIKRAAAGGELPPSKPTDFFHLWYDMIEHGSAQLAKPSPLGVAEDLAHIVRKLHSLWHAQLREESKTPGWGRRFDEESDKLLGEAGGILSERGEVCETAYRFLIAYGRLSMGLPYIAYHTVDAIVMTFGALAPDQGSDSNGM